MRKKRGSHPKQPKRYGSKESYRKFRAYIHMRTPTGKQAISPSRSISGQTPQHKKERVVVIAGKKHRPQLTK